MQRYKLIFEVGISIKHTQLVLEQCHQLVHPRLVLELQRLLLEQQRLVLRQQEQEQEQF
jgi:hypothetical protein